MNKTAFTTVGATALPSFIIILIDKVASYAQPE